MHEALKQDKEFMKASKEAAEKSRQRVKEIPKPVVKIGSSWVIKLDKEARQMLGITKVGETVTIKRLVPPDTFDPNKKEQIDFEL